MDAPSLDGRWFCPSDQSPDAWPGGASTAAHGGQVDGSTVFRYSEQDGEVWGVYAGGPIRRGYLVGSRDGDRLEFRYVQLDESGNTSAGHCRSTLRVLDDGLLRLDETWQWESQEGSGTCVLDEMPDG